SVAPAGTSVERTLVASKSSQNASGSPGSVGSWMTTSLASVVEPSGPNGSSRVGSWTMTLCPGSAGTVDGAIDFVVSVASRSVSVTRDASAVPDALGIVAVISFGWVTSLCSWSGSVSAWNGRDASAPVPMSPLNATVNPTTSQSAGGSGRVFTASASSSTGAPSAHV